MAVAIVAGAAFSGKARFVSSEIERREAAGELGLVAVDWTRLYLAFYPGSQDAFRDDLVGDAGASRMAGATYDFVVGAVLARELSGYILTQSPERAIALADRFDDAPIFEVVADPGDVASRAETHMRTLRKTVARAARSAMLPRCRRAGVSYFREQHRLVGRAREVRTRGRGYVVDSEPKKPFDAKAFERGLTPKARAARTELQSLGNADPTAENILQFLLRNPVEG